jgi:hypothetical protein
MRKLLQALSILISFQFYGQSPAIINYQGIVRDQAGAALANQPVSLQFIMLQGPSPGTPVFTEVQSVTTNSLGLFSVQIGSSSNLSAVNFYAGTYSLQVNLDASGGTNFIAMGDPQLLASVPFALHANSVPATFSNNVLTIGTNNSFTINIPTVANPTIQASGIAIVSPSTGLNFTVDVPPTSIALTTTAGAAAVSSVAPNNFTINLPPAIITSVTSSGAAVTSTLASNLYSVHVPPTDISVSSSVGVAGVSSLGTNSFNINIPVSATTSLVSSGAATTFTLGSNSYSVNVPVSNISVSSTVGLPGVSSSGTNSFAINIPPPIQYTSGPGISITSGTVINNISPDQIVAITGTNGVTVNGVYPNFTISPPPLSLNGAGIVTVSPGPAFVIGAPSPSFSSAGPSSITGVYPNLTITSPVTPTVSAAGIATVSAGPNYLVGVQSPSYTSVGPSSITGVYPNLTLTSPVTPTVTAAGIATVSAGPNYLVGVQSPSYTSVGPSSITGVYPNLTLTSPVTPTVTAAGIATVSAGPNYLVGVESPTFTSVGPSSITGVYPNLILNSPVTPTVTAAGIATVSAGPNYVVGVPQPTFAYSNTTGSLTSGTSSAYITPSLSYSAGILSSGPSSNSIAINSGTNALWSTNGNAATNSTVNFIGTTDNTDINFRLNNTKAGRIEGANQSVYFGLLSGPTGTAAGGNVGLGYAALSSITSGFGNTAVGWQALQNTTSGIWNTAIGGASQLNNTTGGSNTSLGYQALRNNTTGNGNIGIGRDALGSNTAGSGNVVIGSFAMSTNTTGSGNTMIGDLAGQNNVSGSGNVFLGNSAGINELGSNKLYIANNSTIAPLIYGDFVTGNVSIGTATANHKLNVDGNIALENTLGAAAPNRIIGFPTGAVGNHGDLTIQAKSNVFSGIAFTGGNLVLSGGDFNLSGATGPNGGNVIVRAGRNSFDGSGGGDIVFQASGIAYTERMRIRGVNGFVGIGTAAPNAPLQFANTNLNRKIVLVETANNNHQFIGFGNGANELRYQVNAAATSHVFYSAIGAVSSLELFRITGDGNVGIANPTPNAPLQFANTIVNRKIVLWEAADNDHQFYGLGINGGTLRYQVDATSAAHVFFAGTSPASSNEIFRINGTGHIRMGNEIGTGQGPAYPVGGSGLIIRRIYTTILSAGEVVARTDQMTFERDGSNGGFRITNSSGSGNEVCNCMGVNSAGAAVNQALNNIGLGTTQVYTNGQNIVFLHCIFGDPFNAGHMTEISISRQFPDFFWVGTVTTTQNQ